MSAQIGSQIISKDRVAEHGEVLTSQREVKCNVGTNSSGNASASSRASLSRPAATGTCSAEDTAAQAVSRRQALWQVPTGVGAVRGISRFVRLWNRQMFSHKNNVRCCRERLLEMFQARYAGRFTFYQESVYRGGTVYPSLQIIWSSRWL